MAVLVTFKNEEDPIKNQGSRVRTKLYIDFSDAQWQIIISGGIWPSFECSPYLQESKVNALEC